MGDPRDAPGLREERSPIGDRASTAPSYSAAAGAGIGTSGRPLFEPSPGCPETRHQVSARPFDDARKGNPTEPPRLDLPAREVAGDRGAREPPAASADRLAVGPQDPARIGARARVRGDQALELGPWVRAVPPRSSAVAARGSRGSAAPSPRRPPGGRGPRCRSLVSAILGARSPRPQSHRVPRAPPGRARARPCATKQGGQARDGGQWLVAVLGHPHRSYVPEAAFPMPDNRSYVHDAATLIRPGNPSIRWFTSVGAFGDCSAMRRRAGLYSAGHARGRAARVTWPLQHSSRRRQGRPNSRQVTKQFGSSGKLQDRGAGRHQGCAGCSALLVDVPRRRRSAAEGASSRRPGRHTLVRRSPRPPAGASELAGCWPDPACISAARCSRKHPAAGARGACGSAARSRLRPACRLPRPDPVANFLASSRTICVNLIRKPLASLFLHRATRRSKGGPGLELELPNYADRRFVSIAGDVIAAALSKCMPASRALGAPRDLAHPPRRVTFLRAPRGDGAAGTATPATRTGSVIPAASIRLT